jgi:hypothetical protein
VEANPGLGQSGEALSKMADFTVGSSNKTFSSVQFI